MENEKQVTPPPLPSSVLQPARDVNQRAFYTLLKGEEILLELKIDQASRSGFDLSSFVSVGFIMNILEDIPIIGGFISCFFADQREGVFVITNMRCLVSQVTVSGCMKAEKQRTFWAFPRSALNQSVGYEKSSEKVCCCCGSVFQYELDVGLTIGNESEHVHLEVNESNITSDDQALAICAKIAELGQHANA